MDTWLSGGAGTRARHPKTHGLSPLTHGIYGGFMEDLWNIPIVTIVGYPFIVIP